MGFLVDAFVPPLALRVFRRVKLLIGIPQRTRFGLDGIDDRLAAHLDLSQPGFYLELGANDGLSASNTVFLEREYGWRGLLIEPALNRYLELIRNRADAGNILVCAACVSFGYDSEFVRLAYANLMTVSLSLETDLPDESAHLQSAVQWLRDEREVVEFGAVARTLQSLLDEHSAPAVIDFFSLDVEGAELEVLKGVDHSRTRFRHLLVECRDIERLSAYLEPLGYEYQATLSRHQHPWQDYLFRDMTPHREDR